MEMTVLIFVLKLMLFFFKKRKKTSCSLNSDIFKKKIKKITEMVCNCLKT